MRLLLALGLFAPATDCGANSQQARKNDPSSFMRQTPLDDAEAEKYCANIAASITAVRIARQEKQLREAENLLRQKKEELEAKRQELSQLVEKFEALVRKADESIIALYTKMKPEAAAAQIASLDDEVAAAVLMQMKVKSSSAILNEMEAGRGAALMKKIVALSSLPRPGKSK